MADVDIDPFGEHESRPEETGENIPLDLVTLGRSSTWEPPRRARNVIRRRISKN